MLKELSKHDSKWRNIAFSLCGNKMLADDLVNDMYLKMAKRAYNQNELRVCFIRHVIYNQFLDFLRKEKKNASIQDFHIQNLHEIKEGFDDKEIAIIKSSKIDESEKELLRQNYDNSLRQISEKESVGVNIIFRKLSTARKNVLGDSYETEYKNRRLKHKR
tara:strand:- start:770 stop:1252 length:483 start_codon:yes stop_codon:yes gene_type:complete